MRSKFINFFKDDNGELVIAQWPNGPLWLALLFYLVRTLSKGLIQELASIGFSITILYWSYLELFYGVNYFRRLLGLVVGISVMLNLMMLL